MIYKNPLKYAIAVTMICSFTSAYCQQTEQKEPQAQISKEQLSAEHYVSHMVTGIASNVAHGASILAGLMVGKVALNAGLADWIGHQRGTTPPNLKCDDGATIGAILGVPTALGSIAGLYIIYKTPQWTDKYILKKTKERTTRQNVIVFLHRISLGWLGVLTGEYFTH